MERHETFTTRRMLLAGMAACGLMPRLPALAQAQWPQGRTIKMVVPFPPAGATDVLARLLADQLGRHWGINFVIENKPGAGGNIGTDAVAKAEPNGESWLMVSVGMATNQYLYPRLTYDPVADFAPVSLLALVPNLLVAGNHLPVSSVAELIAYGKANPGKLSYGSSGVGTSVHLSGELFKKLTGIDMVHVPYRGTAQATQDLIGGRIDLIFGTKCENDIDRIKQIISEVLAEDHRILKEPAPEVGVLEWGTKGMSFAVRPWVKTKDYWAVYFKTQESMKKRFDQAGIAIPETPC